MAEVSPNLEPTLLELSEENIRKEITQQVENYRKIYFIYRRQVRNFRNDVANRCDLHVEDSVDDHKEKLEQMEANWSGFLRNAFLDEDGNTLDASFPTGPMLAHELQRILGAAKRHAAVGFETLEIVLTLSKPDADFSQVLHLVMSDYVLTYGRKVLSWFESLSEVTNILPRGVDELYTFVEKHLSVHGPSIDTDLSNAALSARSAVAKTHAEFFKRATFEFLFAELDARAALLDTAPESGTEVSESGITQAVLH